ncbi:TonB family protein [Massilia sp. PAMC28688]|uniref:TonB family protein n=1 Tax=Massilia sp. PAMC28688 TaxID=2861283 RepID=UPI001C633109|nr:TonB family protein [Massilia sp. PAMC28688]QYF93532.1 TonB family protein [Massilia sp. PAMC28688]
MKFGSQPDSPAASRTDRRLFAAVGVSLLLHGLALLLQFGVPGMGLPGTPPPLTVTIVPAAMPPAPLPAPAPLPMPSAPPVTIVPTAPATAVSGMRLVDIAPPAPPPVAKARRTAKKDKPRRVRRVSTPLPERELLLDPTPVLAQDAIVNDFAMPIARPQEAEDKSLDLQAAREGEEEGDAEVAAALAEEAGRAGVEEERLAREARQRADEEAARQARLEQERRREQDLVLEQERLAQLAREQIAQQEAQQEAQQKAAQQQREEEQRLAQQLERERAEAKLAQQKEQQQRAEQEQLQLARQREQQQRAELEQTRLAQQRMEQDLADRQRIDQQRIVQQELERQRTEQLAAQRRAEQLAQQQREAAEQAAAQRRAEQLAEQQREAAEQAAAQRRAEQLAQQQREAAEQAAAQRAADRLAAEQKQKADLLAAERARNAAGTAPGNGGADGLNAGPGGSGARGQLPRNAMGSDLANRARDMLKGIDVLKGDPPGPLLRDNRRVAVGANERDLPLKMYVESWRQKIERNASVNFPASWADRRPGDIERDILVSVAVRSDGSVEDVVIVRSSGLAEMDEAVRRIVRVNARYAPFPAAIAQRYDVIDVRRVWRFGATLRLMEEVR